MDFISLMIGMTVGWGLMIVLEEYRWKNKQPVKEKVYLTQYPKWLCAKSDPFPEQSPTDIQEFMITDGVTVSTIYHRSFNHKGEWVMNSLYSDRVVLGWMPMPDPEFKKK